MDMKSVSEYLRKAAAILLLLLDRNLSASLLLASLLLLRTLLLLTLLSLLSLLLLSSLSKWVQANAGLFLQ